MPPACGYPHRRRQCSCEGMVGGEQCTQAVKPYTKILARTHARTRPRARPLARSHTCRLLACPHVYLPSPPPSSASCAGALDPTPMLAAKKQKKQTRACWVDGGVEQAWWCFYVCGARRPVRRRRPWQRRAGFDSRRERAGVAWREDTPPPLSPGSGQGARSERENPGVTRPPSGWDWCEVKTGRAREPGGPRAREQP